MKIYDIAVIGAGHAGCEAALAAARLGKKTVLFTLSLDGIANMPCNPSVGGSSKGQLVCEIDALGGEMGRAADATMLQWKMLGRSGGAAVRAIRVQSDRDDYRRYMKAVLESEPNLDIVQAEVTDLGVDEGEVCTVTTAMGAVYCVSSAIVATGTFLRGRIFVGEYMRDSGPDGMPTSTELVYALNRLGIETRRFKTGTPARVHADSVDYTTLAVQHGESDIIPFSFDTVTPKQNLIDCHIAYTNETTHEIIRESLHRSPLYRGEMSGTSPRYCPSIEEKIVRFADKERHQLFLEPMGADTKEIYLQGMSSSLPLDVQERFYRSIEGLENVHIMRSAYAIEYDCIYPEQLTHALSHKNIKNLYFAGQINGTSGYEEAAAQGLIAGVNASRMLDGEPPVVIGRDMGYIGVLIDDLVLKGTDEPYRMMTSRAEYRLLLRTDNAHSRLTPLGRDIGLITDERWERFCEHEQTLKVELARLSKLTLQPSEVLNSVLQSVDTSPITTAVKMTDLLRRPQVTYDMLAEFDGERPKLSARLVYQLETEIKYAGYIEKQRRTAAQVERLERISLVGVDFGALGGLSLEGVEKLTKIKPSTLAHASRIPGITPADIEVLEIRLSRYGG